MDKTQNKPWGRIILGSLVVSLLAAFHINLLFQGNGFGIGFIVSLILMIFLSQRKVKKEEIKEFQWKTASILSFLLPVTAIVYSFVFTGMAVSEAGSNTYTQAGTAIGGFIGGGVVTVMAFILGISLGIVFYILSKKSKK